MIFNPLSDRYGARYLPFSYKTRDRQPNQTICLVSKLLNGNGVRADQSSNVAVRHEKGAKETPLQGDLIKIIFDHAFPYAAREAPSHLSRAPFTMSGGA